MGPPSEDGGNVFQGIRVSGTRSGLQWGRRPRTAEIEVIGAEKQPET